MKIILTTLFLFTIIHLSAQTKISGTVKNYNDSIFFINETGGFHNFTSVWRDNRVKITINKNKHFSAIIPEESIGSWVIKTETGHQIFDIIQGKDLELIADFSKRNPLKAIGKNADDFNYTTYSTPIINTYYSTQKLEEKFKHTNIDSVLRYRKELAAFKIRILNQYKNTHKVSGNYVRWLISKYTYEPFERTLYENIRRTDTLEESIVSKITEKGIDDEYAALNTSEYNDLAGFYIYSKLPGKNMSATELFDSVAESGLLKGNTLEVYLSRFMAGLIKFPDSIYNPLFDKYNKMVGNEKLKQYVINRRNDYSNALRPSPANVDSERLSSITDIFKKYKGKVIYIDFWASWCVPCRQEMPNAAILKEKLKGKDIIFLYMAYNDKEKAWLKARSQLGIEGEHYLLNAKMIKEADELFGINGIPHYAIIDKRGQIVNGRADGPGSVSDQLLHFIEQ